MKTSSPENKAPHWIRYLIFLLFIVLILCVIWFIGGAMAQKKASASSAAESTPSAPVNPTHTTQETMETAEGSWSVVNEKAYYRGADGELSIGSREIDGTTYRFLEDGSLSDGWVTIDSVRYHFRAGVLSKGTQVIDGKTCFINPDGTMFVGWYEDERTGDTHYYDFETGASYRGWHDIDGKRYYFYADGALARSTIVDGVSIDADGVADADAMPPEDNSGQPTSKPTTPSVPPKPSITLTEDLARRLDDILDQYGRTPQNIYDYVHDHYTYKWAAEKSVEENALHMLNYGTGSCYNFAALTYLLFQRAGYDVYYVTGLGWQNGTYHCWNLVNFDGGWYYVDSLYVRSAKLTADDLTKKGYKWDKDAFPS